MFMMKYRTVLDDWDSISGGVVDMDQNTAVTHMTRGHRRTVLLVLGLVMAIVLAACGGDGTDTATTVADTAGADATEPAETTPAETTAAAAEEPESETTAPTEDTTAEGGEELGADELPTFRTVNQENLFSLAAVVAEAEGIFVDNGVNVEHIFNPSGADRAALVIGGSGDASILGVGSGMRGFVNDDWHFVGTMVQAGGANALSCNPELGIESVADLAGQGLGLAAADGSGTYLTFLEIIAPEFGLEPSDWELVNLPTSERLAAVASGSAGCMLNQEPILTQAAEEGLAEIVEDGIYDAYDLNHQVLYVSTAFLESEGGEEATVRFVKSLHEAADVIAADPAAAAQTYIDLLGERGIDVGDEAELIQIGVEKQGYQICIGDDFRENLQLWAEIQVGLGELEEVPDFDQYVEWELNERATGGC